MTVKLAKRLAKLIILVFCASCSPKIALTNSNSFGTTEAYLMKVGSSNDGSEENTNETVDENSNNTEVNVNNNSQEYNEKAENEIKQVCAGDLLNCDNLNFRKIVRPTGGCSRPNSCFPILKYLLHIYPYDYTKYEFKNIDSEDEPITVIVNKKSKPTYFKNVFAKKIEGLERGKTYNITIETKDDNGNIIIVTLNSISINEQ